MDTMTGLVIFKRRFAENTPSVFVSPTCRGRGYHCRILSRQDGRESLAIVIPSIGRKELGIDTGDTLLVFKILQGHGLALVKADAIEEMLSTMSERLVRFGKLLEDYKSPETEGEKER